MELIQTPIADLLIIRHKIWEDSRGYFMESFQSEKFREAGISNTFVQDNVSSSKKGVLRGLHAQIGPQAQGKLVRVLRGKVWDVAIDFRANSPTYGQYFGLELQEHDGLSFWIPPGFLHGFLTLSEDTIFSYKVTGFYDQANEVGVCWNDATLGIDWPELECPLIISEKDAVLPAFDTIKAY